MGDKTFNEANSTKAIGGIFVAKVLPIAISKLRSKLHVIMARSGIGLKVKTLARIGKFFYF